MTEASEGKGKEEQKSGGEEAGGEAAGAEGKRVDESWKEQVRREREEEAEGEGSRGSRRAAAPKPDILLLVNSLAMQALLSLGEVVNPETGKAEVELEQAKYAIDLLAVVEEKTRGNLSPDEEKVLKSVLYDLRTRYVAMAASQNPIG